LFLLDAAVAQQHAGRVALTIAPEGRGGGIRRDRPGPIGANGPWAAGGHIRHIDRYECGFAGAVGRRGVGSLMYPQAETAARRIDYPDPERFHFTIIASE
jgi:hypothetical protein